MHASRRANGFELAGGTLVPAGATLTVLLALTLALGLLGRGWQDVWFVITAPSPQGVGAALHGSLVILAMALPLVTVIGFFAAASIWDARIGGSPTGLLLAWLPWASGVPPVIVGCAIYFSLVLLGLPFSLPSAACALIILNAPNAALRMLRILRQTPSELADAATAAGAGPVFVLLRVSLPRAAREILGSVCQSAAEIVGQTAVVILAVGTMTAGAPLPAQIWHFAGNRSLLAVASAQCIVLLALVLGFAILADVLVGRSRRRHTDRGMQA
ncbi:MAG: ABC transporter permease subunit [Candidatus Eremiobacteraeota bacterium]|nr:ABC transporter permease subunit [Candidatus Eremiobacteraeota bacterium]